ncbi:hypothetical protein BKA61DRAFT_622861 [Leptodontidium sp. MPI-SDFR-AT-0119]|nr:hypothetical protein BKA61DRAFT_622861 [Leptodontidium sp. MPI-SDFR-AT-0119]
MHGVWAVLLSCIFQLANIFLLHCNVMLSDINPLLRIRFDAKRQNNNSPGSLECHTTSSTRAHISSLPLVILLMGSLAATA